MPTYTATNANADAGLLAGELTAAELPISPDGGVSGPDADGVITVATTRDLTAEEQATLSATVAAHDPASARLNATRAEALGTLLTAGTVRAIQVRAMIVTMQFLTNNLLEFLFQRVADLEGKTREQLVAELTAQFPTNTGPRALDSEAFAYLMANPTAGDPAPTAPAP